MIADEMFRRLRASLPSDTRVTGKHRHGLKKVLFLTRATYYAYKGSSGVAGILHPFRQNDWLP